jgi:hypothetical protein
MRGIGGRTLGLGALPHDHGRCDVCVRVLFAAPISCAKQTEVERRCVNAWGGFGGYVRPSPAC